jgi:hypothetical protein
LSNWENQVSIFHFGGHANTKGLMLQDAYTLFEPLAQELIQRNTESLQLVFLNGCSTQSLVQVLFELGAKAVIATSAEVQDAMASNFAIRFYQNLAQGDNIQTAYQSAWNFTVAKYQSQEKRFRSAGQILRRSELGENIHSPHDNSFPWGLYVDDDTVLDYSISRKNHQGKYSEQKPKEVRQDLQNQFFPKQDGNNSLANRFYQKIKGDKKQLKDLLETDLNQVIEHLLVIIDKYASDKKLLHHVIAQKSSFKELQQDHLRGLITPEQYQSWETRIKAELNCIIETL